MSLQIRKKADKPSFPVFVEVHEDYPGGVTLDGTGLTEGDVILAGALLFVDESARLAKILKTLLIVENAAAGATTYKVAKAVKNQPHLVKQGEVFAKAVGGASYALSTIDTTNANYDLITVGTSLGAMAVGDVLFQSAASGANAGALKYKPNGMLRNHVGYGQNVFVPVVRRATCYNRRLPWAAPQAVKDEFKGTIIFSEQR